MTALNPLLARVFRGPLDLNGPVLGRIFYLFEYARSYSAFLARLILRSHPKRDGEVSTIP
jgi:hypothetical protein